MGGKVGILEEKENSSLPIAPGTESQGGHSLSPTGALKKIFFHSTAACKAFHSPPLNDLIA